MKTKLVCCLILLASLRAYTQIDTAWVRRYNGTGNSADLATGIAVDAEGNVYVTGSSIETSGGVACATIKYDSSGTRRWIDKFNTTFGAIDVGNAITVDHLMNVYVAGSSGAGSYYLTIKYSANGDTSWVRRYDSGVPGPNHNAYAIVVDTEGNVYVTGESDGQTTYKDYATVKYNSVGGVQWVARYASPAQSANDKAVAIAVDAVGNVYVTGKSDGSGTYEDYATVKYDSLGVEQWVARYNGPGNSSDAANGIAVDDSGNVYVTGYSYGVGTGADYATLKYSSSGAELWVRRSVLTGNDLAYAIALDHQGYIYVTGTDGDYATIKYNASGDQQWIARYHGASGLDQAERIVIDRENNVYVTGMSQGTGSNMDIATVKYNSSGVEQWAARYDGPFNALDDASGIAVDSEGNVYVTGYSTGLEQNFDYVTIKYVSGTVGVKDNPQKPSVFELHQNYPNPFNPKTIMKYQIPEQTHVTLKVFDLLGREVAMLVNERKQSGMYAVQFDASNLTSGVYLYRLQAGTFFETRKMVLVR